MPSTRRPMSSHPISRATFLARLAALVLGATVAAPLVARASGRRRGFTHPEPREGVTAERVLPDERLPKKQEVRDAFAIARAWPAILDGLYCACRCEKTHGHRSLLSCFESQQAVGCMGCREEAKIVGRMAPEGRSLAEIRKAVDAEWG